MEHISIVKMRLEFPYIYMQNLKMGKFIMKK